MFIIAQSASYGATPDERRDEVILLSLLHVTYTFAAVARVSLRVVVVVRVRDGDARLVVPAQGDRNNIAVTITIITTTTTTITIVIIPPSRRTRATSDVRSAKTRRAPSRCPPPVMFLRAVFRPVGTRVFVKKFRVDFSVC